MLKKLRYKVGQAIVLGAPEGYDPGLEESGPAEGKYEFLLLFANNAQEVEEWLPKVTGMLLHDALFWIAYPKQTPKSKVKPDINRDILNTMVNDTTAYRAVSNVAIDEKWSALRFRLKELVKTTK